MRRRYPDLAPLLFEPVATDRRGEVPEGMAPWFSIPVLNWYKGHLTGLYHGTYIASASRLEDAPKPSKRQREALDSWDDLTNDPALNMRMRLVPGDMQFVYNHHLMHDRMAFRDWPDPARRRHLLRLWLSLPGDRALPEVFAQRYGSIEIGNRGGIVLRGTALNVSLLGREREAGYVPRPLEAGEQPPSAIRRGDHVLLRRQLAHALLQLLEGPDLDLADALPADAVDLGEVFERHRIVLETAPPSEYGPRVR